MTLSIDAPPAADRESRARACLRLVGELETAEPSTDVEECAALGDADSVLTLEVTVLAQLEILHAPSNWALWGAASVDPHARHRLQFARRRLSQTVYGFPRKAACSDIVKATREDIGAAKRALIELAVGPQ